MGSCLSKKKESSSSPSSNSSAAAATVPVPVPVNSSTATVDLKKCDNTQQVVPKKKELEEVKEEEGVVKKEVFVIKHRKSHDKRAVPNEEATAAAAVVKVAEIEKEKEEIGNNIGSGVVRTSSCTKEEVDAILIQCGRLSRSNSSGKAASSARKYSGSKRSYDFDHDIERERDASDENGDVRKKSSEDNEELQQRQHRQRHRQSSRQSPAGRRRTPSRERDQQQSQQRSGSRERGNSTGSGRRVSRSPGRRSENNAVNTSNNAANGNTNRPGKMVSVPATVTSLVMDKSNNNGPAEPITTTTTVKRISVKRNVGEAAGVVGSRTAASPRSQSPARTHANNGRTSNENQQQPSLSRSSSRKAEHSPYRRNPLSEIDPNSLAIPQSACNNKASNNNNNRVHDKSRETEEEKLKESSANIQYQTQMQKPNADIVSQGTNCKTSSRGTLNNKVTAANIIEREHQQSLEEAKPQTLTRSRSSRRSRDLDLNPETLLNPTPSYTALLLEDIQNFHQKSTPSISLPPCVTKACSILEAVADLNSTTSSILSCPFSEDNKNAYNFSAGIGKKMTEAKDPFVESEVFATDDLTEPSFHKYITVRRGGSALGGVDLDEQESSGSNSFVGSSSTQNWNLSSSSWEPNSADSTDRWTSRSNTKEENQSPLGFQRHASSEIVCDATKNNRKAFTGKRRETDTQKNGNWRGRVAVVAAAAST